MKGMRHHTWPPAFLKPLFHLPQPPPSRLQFCSELAVSLGSLRKVVPAGRAHYSLELASETGSLTFHSYMSFAPLVGSHEHTGGRSHLGRDRQFRRDTDRAQGLFRHPAAGIFPLLRDFPLRTVLPSHFCHSASGALSSGIFPSGLSNLAISRA